MQIDPHGTLESFEGHVEEGMEGTDSGIADESVDAAERRHPGLDKASGALRIRNIALQAEGLLSHRMDFRDAAFGAGRIPEKVDADARPLPRRSDRGRPTDTGRCARDENLPAVEKHRASYPLDLPSVEPDQP